MKKNLVNIINNLVNHLELNSIEELRALAIDNDLICKVANYLLESKEKITFSKIAELLEINRASIYNTYPKSTLYIKALILQQKAGKSQKTLEKKSISIKSKINKKSQFSNLDQEKIEKFMSIIMSLEHQMKIKDLQIHKLQAKIASLQSTIDDLNLKLSL